MKKHVYLTFLLLFAYSVSAWAQGQNPAGPDRSMCKDGVTIIGSPSTCSECCYKWSPETGLNDPNLPNPTVSGLSVSMTYAVTISYPDGNYVTDDVNVTVYDAEIQVWHPDYHLPNTMLDPSQVKVPGVQSFVNLDNDDCDLDFDLDDTEVTGGDNEFIKLRILFSVQLLQRPGKTPKGENLPPGEYKAALSLAQNTTVSGLRFWKSNDKMSGEYLLGNELVLTEVSGSLNQYETYLWVEGTEGHTQQQQVKLFAHAFEDSTPACMDKYVGITIVDIIKVEWVGIDNGYTVDGKNDNEVLDNCPKNGGKRVFSENKTPGKGQVPTNSVNLKVTLSVDPVTHQDLFVRPFDIDDPSNDKGFIDPNDEGNDGVYMGSNIPSEELTYTINNDNRGLSFSPNNNVATALPVGYKEGLFAGVNITKLTESPLSGSNIYKILNANTKEFTLGQFYVSQMCGDNYVVVISNDKIFLDKARNYDKKDKGKIVDKCTESGTTGECLPVRTKFVSDMLTVWRTLHIEYDAMKTPNSEENNKFVGFFTAFDGHLNNTKKIQGIMCENCPPHIPQPLKPLKDRGKSRFQNGGLKIGIPANLFCNPSVGGNGNSSQIEKSTDNEIILYQFADLAAGVNLTGKVTNSSGGSIEFKIRDIYLSGEEYIILFKGDQPDIQNYSGASISIGGGKVFDNVVVTIPNAIDRIKIPVNSLAIPIEVIDDDLSWNSDNSHDPKIEKITNFGDIQAIYSDAYINISVDGGGELANNQDDILFKSNINQDAFPDPYGAELIRDIALVNKNSKGKGSQNYWLIYVVSGWQSATYIDKDEDNEGPLSAPIGEATLAHATEDCKLNQGGDFCAIFHGTKGESSSFSMRLDMVFAHELGHCFGLTHGNGFLYQDGNPNNDNDDLINGCLGVSTPSDMKLMQKGFGHTIEDFIPAHINLIRSRVNQFKKVTE